MPATPILPAAWPSPSRSSAEDVAAAPSRLVDRSTLVLIAGAGIGGLALAIALGERGVPCRVLERRDALSEAGAGIQLGPNSVKVLDVLGVRQALAEDVGVPEAIEMRRAGSPRVLGRLPLGAWIEARHGAPYWVAHRADLQRVLLAKARTLPAIETAMGFRLDRFEERDDAVIAVAESGETAAGTLLVGADGIWSTVRKRRMGGGVLGFTGRTAARCVLPRDRVPEAIDRTCTGVWMSPSAHLVHYWIRGGRELAVIAVFADGHQEEGWAAPCEAAALEEHFAGFAAPARGVIRAGEGWRKWSLPASPPFAAWSSVRVTLLGDAAHPMLPYLSQGGAMALEDAVVLADLIAGADGSVGDALAHYERLRRPRVERVVRASRRNGEIFHLAGFMGRARDAALRALPSTRLMAGYDWLYGWSPPEQLRSARSSA